ncbi:DEAD/DEAH box helicase [Pyrococcus horikoshii]|uniref:DEAD/DEAH box helicase n=2 Tax=Pyrococcus horikoshii TaxID=53953 RepID=A0A832T0V7_PYRHR|nr:DEAD/DEAH box helicase [Pyrococcus horikoshii]HII61734.1 DEAD/DEAH box helicase [Pyrococcus horikoshii]
MYIRKDLLQPRLYQELIYAKCKERNCLIVLPTGLGKTIIAMMIADYRLDKYGGKVLMLAPTKPLVLQHAETFRKFFTLPPEKIVALTGEISPNERVRAWARAKVVIATPQTIENDLLVGRISLEDVTLIIFDEAHRAVGNYAYVYIAKEYLKQAKNPHVIGLTASPGSTPEKIMEVLRNLGIEHIEYRSENSPDVKPYVQGIKFEWVKVELPELYKEVRKLLRDMLRDSLKPLAEAGLLDSTSADIPKKEILRAGQIINEEMAKGNHDLRKLLLFHAMALKLHHAIELLETQGLSALRVYLKRLYEEAKAGSTRASKELFLDKRMKKALALLIQAKELGIDHPKMEVLKGLIREQLKRKENSKIIVFTNYRETAKKVVEELMKDGIKARRFVGQASRENDRGMSQKEQKLILDAFARSEFNVLVATSVGEEGLDVPEVDLVIFYEPVPSAIRSVQRRGRTGRQKPGRVVILMAQGTRDEAYYWSSRQKEKIMRETIRMVSQMVRKERQLSLESYVKREVNEEIKEEKKETGGIKVVIDSRELRSEVVKKLKTLGIKIEVRTLDVGDYIVSEDVAIERKSANDFIQSIIDGRLFDQVKRLKEAYPRPVIIIEGQLYGIRNVHPNAIRGAIASIVLDFGVPVIFSSSSDETAHYIFFMAKREQEERKREVRIRGEKKALTLAERQRMIVESLPNVSTTLARRLLRHFGSVEKVFTASVPELMKVEGIGEKIAREIRRVITSPYIEEE